MFGIYQDKTVTAVVLAAGNSVRMGLNINKVYIRTGNCPIVLYSLNAFDAHPYIDEIVIVVRGEDMGTVKRITGTKSFKKPVRIVIGGRMRCDSVYNALSCIDSDVVIIHDSARPLIKQRYITDCIKAMDKFNGAVIGVKAKEIIAVKDGDNVRRELDSRHYIHLAQTPQCFHTNVLRECHEAVADKSCVTDDSQLLEMAGYQVRLLPGDESNIKITTPVDIALAGAFRQGRAARVAERTGTAGAAGM